MKTLNEFLTEVMPILLSHTVDRIDKTVLEGKVSVYWVKEVLRIDVRFKSQEFEEEF
jgi:hypothetical protein